MRYKVVTTAKKFAPKPIIKSAIFTKELDALLFFNTWENEGFQGKISKLANSFEVSMRKSFPKPHNAVRFWNFDDKREAEFFAANIQNNHKGIMVELKAA